MPTFSRITVSRLSLLLACALLVISGLLFAPGVGAVGLAAILFVLGAEFVWLALALSPRTLYPATDPQTDPHRPRWLPLLAGIACLSLLTTTNITLLPAISQHVQMALLVGGVLLIAWSFVPRGSRMLFLPLPNALGRGSRGGVITPELWLLLAITLLALFLRTVALETVNHRLLDETHYIDAMLRLWENPDTPLLTPFNDLTAFTWAYPYWQLRVRELIGPGMTALRLLSAILGTLTIPALWWLARQMFWPSPAGNPVRGWGTIPLIAALLLATFPPHIHFSRIGINNIADPLLGVLALAFALKGIRTGGRRWFAWGGLALGLTQYFYEGGRLFYPVLIALWLIVLLVVAALKDGGLTSGLRRQVRGSAWLLLTFMLLAAPVYLTWIAGDFGLTPRLDEQGASTRQWLYILLRPDGLQFFWRYYLGQTLLAFVHLPETGWFYTGETALLLPWVVPVFLLGLAVALWRIVTPGGVLLILWLFGTALANTLMVTPLWTPRYIIAFPAIALVLAWGLVELWRLGAIPARRWALRFGVVGLLVLAFSQPVYYFGRHLPLFHTQNRVMMDVHDAIFRLMDLPPGTQAYFVDWLNATLWEGDARLLLDYWGVTGRSMQVVLPNAFDAEFLAAAEPDRPLAFFIRPGDDQALVALRVRFDGRVIGPFTSPYGVPDAWQYELYLAGAVRVP